MKVALVHDWLVAQRGGENVLLELARLFPAAPVFSLVHTAGAVHAEIESHPIHTSFIQRLPGAATSFRRYLPLFPKAIESFDLRSFDLVVSTSHCVAKGVKTHDRQWHISYVHTPMRYLWDQLPAYLPVKVPDFLVRACLAPLRHWDVRSARRPDQLLANSNYVAQRIQTVWGRSADVVYPPVDVAYYSQCLNRGARNGYLVVSALVPYKRVDLAVAAANEYSFDLTIIGDGVESRRLRAMAGPTVTFLNSIADRRVLRSHYAKARGLLFCGVEDFGIVPVEAMAAGCSVVAFKHGGALETVRSGGENATGVFFAEQRVGAIKAAIDELERRRHAGQFRAPVISAQMARFAIEQFRENILAALPGDFHSL